MKIKKFSSEKNSLCKLIKQYVILYCSVSSIQSLHQIVRKRRHPIERIIWALLVVTAICAAGFSSSITLSRYRENPTVISMERDRFAFNTSFPTATICPSTKVDEEYLESYLRNASHIENKDLYRKFISSLLEATYNNLEDIVDYPGVSGESLLDLVVKFQFKFRPLVSNSAPNQRNYNLKRTITEMGVCYSFNSHLAVYSSYEYWKSNSWKILPEEETFYVNPLDGEVFANTVNMSTGYKLFIHGPYEVADISSKYFYSQIGYFYQLGLSGLTIFSSESTKSLTVQQRKCRFYYESNLKHSPVYSYVLCMMECRANLAEKLCGCLPHFYRKLENIPTCNVKGLHCLSKYKEQFISLSRKECACLSNCDDVNFFLEETERREWFLGSSLQWGLFEYPKMRLKRDVIFGFSDLLVYTGGMVGLFLGCSVLSFMEIFYFLTLRLYWFLKKRHNL